MMAAVTNREAVMANDDEQKRRASEARQQGVFVLMLTALGVVALLFIAAMFGVDLTG